MKNSHKKALHGKKAWTSDQESTSEESEYETEDEFLIDDDEDIAPIIDMNSEYANYLADE